ncbi:hypothetical protein [Micromonospora sp. NPDC049102]|uniref:hypothetical protein n=1 Tax=Micromonospora sp. NPDC049102 TaxID=3364265 RepID=UPI003715E9EA
MTTVEAFSAAAQSIATRAGADWLITSLQQHLAELRSSDDLFDSPAEARSDH